jgi:hypothetical protein
VYPSRGSGEATLNGCDERFEARVVLRCLEARQQRLGMRNDELLLAGSDRDDRRHHAAERQRKTRIGTTGVRVGPLPAHAQGIVVDARVANDDDALFHLAQTPQVPF